jgi:hypothetical protein
MERMSGGSTRERERGHAGAREWRRIIEKMLEAVPL